MIADIKWYFILGALLAIASLALVIVRPMYALVLWIILSPLISRLFSLDWGVGLPSLTFNRCVFYSLAISLLARGLVRRTKLGSPRLGEWLLIAFPVYIACTAPFFPFASTTQFGLMLMQRAVDLSILYFVAKSCVSEPRHVAWIVVSLVIVGLYSGLMGLYDHLTGQMSLVALIGVHAGLIWSDVGGRSAGPFLNPALLAMFMGITAALAFHCAGHARSAATKLFCYAVMPVLVLACYWTYTRGGYLLLVISFLLMPFLARSGRKRYVVILLVGALAVSAAIPAVMSNPQVRYRLTSDQTTRGRLVAGAALINLIKHHPWFGVGLGNGNVEMIRYVESTGGIPGMLIWQGIGAWSKQWELPEYTTSHSTYLTVLADHGVLGGLIYIGTYAAFIVHLWRIRRRLPSSGLLSRDFAVLVLTLLLGSTLSINTLRVENHEYVIYVVWVLAAATIRLGELQPREAEGIEERPVPAMAEVAYGE